MKVLVTGAGGFIGNHVIQKLLSGNHEVIVSDLSLEAVNNKEWFRQVRFVQHDIDRTEQGENLFEKFLYPDRVIHLAWAGLPNYRSLFHFERNLPNQYAFIKNLVANGLMDLTVAGTCFEYGMKSGRLEESMCCEPDNSYALAKNSLRLFVNELKKEKPFHFKWVRLFYLYGKGQNPRSLLAQLDTALANNDEVFNMSGGEQVRDYLPVEEVAKNLVRIAEQQKVEGVINCCSNEPITVKQLVLNHLKKTNKTIRLNFGFYPYPNYEPMEFWGDNSKLKSITNEQSN